MENKILVVEDDPMVRNSLVALLTQEGYLMRSASDGPEALQLLPQETFQAVILDINLPTMTGLEVLSKIQRMPVPPLVIMLTAHGSVQNAVAAMKAGAVDFLVKPCPTKELKTLLKNIVTRHNTIEEPSESHRLIGEASQIQHIRKLVNKVAPTDSNVFIFGETGTGKDLVARAIHYNSKRRHKPFVKIDCAILPGELLESELFGHERGAFTGASERFIGKFEQAEGGTVFLDEISNLTLTVQAKLLNVIQDRELTRLKGSAPVKINIRLISASNKDIKQAVKEGKFREDLFYRLDVVPVTLPSLKERKEDIPLLCDYFLRRFNKLNQKNITGIEPAVSAQLMSYDWPGNVRELANLMEQAVVMTEHEVIRHEDLPSKIKQFLPVALENTVLPVTGSAPTSLKESKQLSEINLIINTLKETKGNKKKAAEILKISRVALHKKIKEYRLEV